MPANMIVGNSFWSRNICRSRQGDHSYRARISNRSFFEEIIGPKVECWADRNVVEWRIFGFWLEPSQLSAAHPPNAAHSKNTQKVELSARSRDLSCAAHLLNHWTMCGCAAAQPPSRKIWFYINDLLYPAIYMSRLAGYWKLGTMNSDFKCRHCRC